MVKTWKKQAFVLKNAKLRFFAKEELEIFVGKKTIVSLKLSKKVIIHFKNAKNNIFSQNLPKNRNFSRVSKKFQRFKTFNSLLISNFLDRQIPITKHERRVARYKSK
jgi:hypothetical protein